LLLGSITQFALNRLEDHPQNLFLPCLKLVENSKAASHGEKLSQVFRITCRKYYDPLFIDSCIQSKPVDFHAVKCRHLEIDDDKLIATLLYHCKSSQRIVAYLHFQQWTDLPYI